MAHLRPAVPLILLALAGCGGEKQAAAPKAPTQAAATPQTTLRAVESALHDVDSFHIEGTITDEDGKSRLEGDVGHGAARLSIHNDGKSARMLVLGEDEVYMRANAAFWRQMNAPAQVQELLTDRWARIPADDEVTEIAELLQPDVLADCIDEGVGTLRVRKDGDDVLVLVDAGDKPGTSPGELHVSADEPQLPLRIRQLGPGRPGGPPPDPRCTGSSDEDETDDGETTGLDLRFSRWDQPVDIKAPADALDLEELARQAEGRSTV